jgi:hypothetical protein
LTQAKLPRKSSSTNSKGAQPITQPKFSPRSRLFELARVLVCLHQVARFIENANHSIKKRQRVPIRPAALIMLLRSVMFGKITVSLAVGLALFAVTVRLPAAPCIVANTPSSEACQPGCCANKACCATSQERTGPPVQPLAKSSPDQQNVATITATIVFASPVQVATEPRNLLGAERMAHSPPLLSLTCIRLI